MNTICETKPAAKRARKMAREPNADAAAIDPKRTTKSDLIIEMLSKAEGATLDELVAATSWLPHTTRAALTGLKKKGHTVISEKHVGVRRYRVVGGTA